MTNNYSSEPNDHEVGHDEVISNDQEVVREAPSDYEFADDHGSPIAEEHNEEHSSIETETKAKGRSPLLPIVAAVSGVVLLGAVAWWQFGSSKSTSAPPAAMPVLSSSVEPNKASDAAPAVDPNAFPASTVAPTTNATDAAALASLSSGTAPANPSSAPSSPAPPMAMTATNASPTPPSPPSGIAASPGSNGQLNSRIETLNARMDELQHSLDQAVLQLGQVTNMVAASPVKDVQDRLDKIEQQLADLHHSAPKLASPAGLPGDTAVPAHSALPQPTAKIKMHHTATIAHETHKTGHHSEIKTSAKAVSEPNWVLRAASPGQAWIATDTSTHDLKQVQVGDSLPGIGKIVAISQQSGNWVVQGSTGSIQ